MKKLRIYLSILLIICLSWRVEAQTLTYSFVDPCTKAVTYFSIPATGTVVYFYGQSRTFTSADVASGAFATWINQVYSDYRKISPCGQQQGQVTQNQITSQIIGNTVQSVVSSIMSQAQSAATSTVTSVATSATTAASSSASSGGGGGTDAGGKNNKDGDSKSNKNENNGTSSSNSSNGTGGNGNSNGNSNNTGGSSSSSSNQGSNQTDTKTDQKGGEVVGSTTMTTDTQNQNSASSDGGGGGSSSDGGGKSGGGGGKGGGKNGKSGSTNPVIVSSDFTTAQNLDKTFTPILNLSMSQSSMTGMSSWGTTAMVWFNFKQFALSSKYTKINFSKSGKLKWINNFSLTGVYSYGNILGFIGYSGILNAGKFGVTGFNASAAMTLVTGDQKNTFISPSLTAFYTKPFKASKRITVSPELYIISTPLIYSTVDKVTTTDRTFSAFIGSGFDYQISRRFKLNMNYKANLSTNPDFPILSFFLIGSKINL